MRISRSLTKLVTSGFSNNELKVLQSLALVQEKATELFPSLYPEKDESSFKASLGCLHKFCQRHSVKELSLQSEALSADTSAVEPFCQLLINKIEAEGYSM